MADSEKTKLEALTEMLESTPQDAYDLMKDFFKSGVEDFKAEYEGERNFRPKQVGRRVDKKKSTVSRLAFNFQKKIVKTATSFLFGEPVSIMTEDDGLHEEIEMVWNRNRMDTILQDFSTTLKSETEAVLMFYTKETDDGKQIKVRLFNSDLGKYAPYYDEYGDLIAFMWEFKAKVEGEDVDHFWAFTDEATYRFRRGDSDWEEYIPKEPNLIKKIPVVFMRQEYPEWWDVKDLIDRYEMGFSKFVDMNDYFAAPTLVVTGEITKLPEKDKDGRAVKIPRVFDGQGQEKTGKLEYLTWQHAPESIKNEFQVLKEMIYSQSDTPDISFDNLKGIAPASGEAMKMQFMGAELKAKETHGKFEEAIHRILQIIIGLGSITKEVRTTEELPQVKFNSVVPKAVSELIETLQMAVGNEPVMSKRTAVEYNPLVNNPEEELQRMEEDRAKGEGSTFQ